MLRNEDQTGSDRFGGSKGANVFRFSLHLPEDEDAKAVGPIREVEDALKLRPVTMEDETLKLLPKSFRPFKSNEEYLQVGLVLYDKSGFNCRALI